MLRSLHCIFLGPCACGLCVGFRAFGIYVCACRSLGGCRGRARLFRILRVQNLKLRVDLFFIFIKLRAIHFRMLSNC